MWTRTFFGETEDGVDVYKFIWEDRTGLKVHILEYGATIQKLFVPQISGEYIDVVLGFDSLKDYEGEHPYFGAIIGRNANRLANGQCIIKGKKIQLTRNEGFHQLHGGCKGFDKRVWSGNIVEDKLILTYVSEDGEEGFPGTLTVETTFEIEGNQLDIEVQGRTTVPTIVNITRHDYFNLDQGKKDTILEHQIKINADQYTPVNEAGIPLGTMKTVNNTLLDYRVWNRSLNDTSSIGSGNDHNYILNERQENDPAAQLLSASGALQLKVYCTHPCIQFFSAYEIGEWSGKYGRIPSNAPGLCLEPQYFIDATHHDTFPDTVLDPSTVYNEKMSYSFTTNEI